MLEVAATARTFVWDQCLRLPLAGTRIRSAREEGRARPLVEVASPCIETTEYLDHEAKRLSGKEIQCRNVRARLVATLMKRRLWRPLGFVRLPDYAAERLGLRARSLQEDARVVTALESLPKIRAAFDTGALRWTHARLLAGVATPSSEDEWLQLALTLTSRHLAELVKGARENDRSATDEAPEASSSTRAHDLSSSISDPDACASRAAVAISNPDACASRAAGAISNPDACASRAPVSISDPDACASRAAGASPPRDSECSDPSLFWSIDVTRPGRRLWRTLNDLASRMCGIDVPASRVAEAVAAEAIGWDAWEPPAGEPLPPRAPRARSCEESVGETVETAAPRLEPRRELEDLLLDLDAADAHEIDRRLQTVGAAMQRIDAELGTALRKVFEHNVPRRLGFASLRAYAENRLGICGSKAMALVRLDRQCALRSPVLLRAYREGSVTWLAATTLLPVISRQHENAWVSRAGQVTLRRLEAEVSWALDRADETGGRTWQAPPPLDLDVTTDAYARWRTADIQMRAHPGTDLQSFGRRTGARIGIVMPESVASLLDDAIEGCRHAIEPRWRGFERILAHAWMTWMALPQHENPVYARDSHRCQVPGCRSRGPLHAHHVWFRSKGGPDLAWNLTSVCEDHHRAIHRREIRVRGRAPHDLVWELGCRPGHRPLVRLRGDAYWNECDSRTK